MVGRLAKQGGQKGASAWATLNKLMDSNLSAKYWVTGRLAPTDILTECEFFDAGLVSVFPLSLLPFFCFRCCITASPVSSGTEHELSLHTPLLPPLPPSLHEPSCTHSQSASRTSSSPSSPSQ